MVLGIDVGTTSVKVVIVQKDNPEVILANQSKDTQANVPSDLGIEGNKQDVPKILSAVHNCVSRLPKDLLRQVCPLRISSLSLLLANISYHCCLFLFLLRFNF